MVSAAAGSGKTAVLVERVISKITRETNPISLERLLVMTFSGAAAAQMREKIAARLYALSAAQPGHFALKRQQMLLPGAGISTVHSFCLGLIREHFSSLGLSHDFRVADEGEAAALRQEAAGEVMEAYYQAGNPDFADLVELTCGFRDDRKLAALLEQLLEFIRSHPFPQRWLSQKLALYDPEIPLSQSVWGKRALAHGAAGIDRALELAEQAIALAGQQEKMQAAYGPALEDDRQQLLAMRSAFASGDFDRAREAAASYTPKKLGRLTGCPDEQAKALVQKLRGEVKSLCASLQEGCMASGSAQFAQDMAWLRPKIQVLFEAVTAFEQRYSEKKRERSLIDFADIEHFALALLVRPQGETGYRRTALAQELAGQYDEILVDEYQDTNEAQDMIFKALSQDEENLFFVGDVKQSIYRFRNASPELFLEKRARFSPAREGKFPATVILDQNFRSARGITQGVNFLFRQLMSREAAGLDYTAEEELRCGREYPESPLPAVQVHLLTPAEGESADACEAAHVAAEIQRHVETGLLLTEGESQRPARWGDFCILLRSLKGKAAAYEEALRARGIPVSTDREDSFFQRPEIMTALSLLQSVSNPLQDVPLAALLSSPAFSFSFDEITGLRLRDKKAPLYLCLCQAAEAGDAKSAAFLETLAKLRELAAVMGAARFLQEAYRITRLPLLCGQDAAAKSNLYLLLEYALGSESAGWGSLTGFLRYLRRIRESGKELPAAAPPAEENSVRIMSIHKSKGLEFPFCILADTAKRFNKLDLYQTALLHPRLGFSTMVREKETLRQYTTVAHEAVKLELEGDLLSEEMRVLYVALTRPKEHLLITWAGKDAEKQLAQAALQAGEGDRLSPYAVRSGRSYGDWLLSCLVRHPDCQPLLQAQGIRLSPLPCKTRWDIKTLTASPPPPTAEEETPQLPPPDQALLQALRQQAAWRYPHRTDIPAKLSVSELSHQERFDFTGVPAFLAGEGLSPAQRGTALHKVMQFADYQLARNNIAAEADRLALARFLSKEERESLDLPRLARLFSGPLMGRILQSPQLLREVKFFYELPPGEYLGKSSSGMDDPIILQGIADCVFLEGDEAVLVDYKTDRVQTGSQLAERYCHQLALYREALENGLGKRVKETILYSVYLGEEVRLDKTP